MDLSRPKYRLNEWQIAHVSVHTHTRNIFITRHFINELSIIFLFITRVCKFFFLHYSSAFCTLSPPLITRWTLEQLLKSIRIVGQISLDRFFQHEATSAGLLKKKKKKILQYNSIRWRTSYENYCASFVIEKNVSVQLSNKDDENFLESRVRQRYEKKKKG